MCAIIKFMDIMELSKQKISEESVGAALEFAHDFSHRLQKIEGRLPGTEEETECARTIRSRLEEETDVPVRLEAFRARPSLGRGSFYMLGLWYILSYVIYYISFIGGRLAGILITLVALLNFLIGCTVILLLFLGAKRPSALLRQEISYNVVSEFPKNRDKDVKERVIVIADNHDAMQGSVLRDYGILRRLTVWLSPISAFVFILFCILKMAIGTEAPDESAKITLLTVIPAVLGVMGVVVTLLHYSPLKRHAKPSNGISTCVAMATYSYFAEQPELLPDDVRIVYASFGAENAGHGGEEAFCRAHPEFADAYVICLAEMAGGELKLAEYDPIRRLGFSTQLASSLSGAAHELGEEVSTVPHGGFAQKLSQLHGYMSTPFAKAGVNSATLLSVGDRPSEDLTRRLFMLTVNAVFRLFSDIAPIKADAKYAPEPSTDAQMHTISSK